MQGMRWVIMPLAKPPRNPENPTIMTSSDGGFGTVIPKESAIWMAPMVPAASSGPTSSARRRSHKPEPGAIGGGDCGGGLLTRTPGGPNSTRGPGRERYQTPAPTVDG